MNRLSQLSSDPTLVNFAQDYAQSAITGLAEFLAPSVEVPTTTGHYKIYDAKHRFKRPVTRRGSDGKATRIGFDSNDAVFKLSPNALDFPIPEAETLGNDLMNYAQYGATLLADAAALAHEGEVIDKALATVGAGTSLVTGGTTTDVVNVLDNAVKDLILTVRNGAPVKIGIGPTAYLRLKNNKSVRERYVAAGGSKFATPTLADLSSILFTTPEVQMTLMVQDTAAEGVADSTSFMLDNAILLFASKSTPNTMDPSFMKTFRLKGAWMKPGSYNSEDGRDQVLKMDWYEQVVVTNASAITRLNAVES